MPGTPSTKKKVVVITGASGGLGLAMVQRFLDNNTITIATDLKSSLAAIKSQTFSKHPNLCILPMDVCDWKSIQEQLKVILDRYGRVDILVNNAGIFDRTPATSANRKQIEKIIDVNLTGTLRCIHTFSAPMIRQKWGRIINIGSIAGEGGAALASSYAASKAGIIAATLSFARELAGFGICINAIVPGYFDTPMLEKEKSLVEAFILPRIPKARLGNSDEISEVVYFLASCCAEYLTGSVIRVDGGLSVG